MRQFRTLAEIDHAGLPDNLRRAVSNALQAILYGYGDDYDPDDCGWILLVDQTTTEDDARELFGVGWGELVTKGS